MKKLILLLAALIGLVSAKPVITTKLIDRLLNFSIEECASDALFTKIWEGLGRYGFDTDSRSVYHTCRTNTYDSLSFNSDPDMDGDSAANYWTGYIEARTVVVARFKDYLHEGDNLKKMFLRHEPRFHVEISKLDDKQKGRILKNLQTAKQAFELMLDKKKRVEFEKWIAGSQNPSTDYDRAEGILSKNLTAKQTASLIAQGKIGIDVEPDQNAFFEGFGDKYMAKFAGRRYREGGEALLKKYIVVIDLAIGDVK